MTYLVTLPTPSAQHPRGEEPSPFRREATNKPQKNVNPWITETGTNNIKPEQRATEICMCFDACDVVLKVLAAQPTSVFCARHVNIRQNQ